MRLPTVARVRRDHNHFNCFARSASGSRPSAAAATRFRRRCSSRRRVAARGARWGERASAAGRRRSCVSLSFTLPLSNSLVLILRARARACVRPAARRARETGRATVATCAHFAGRAAALECDAHAKRDRVCVPRAQDSRCSGLRARATGRETRATSANFAARIQSSDRVRAREAGGRATGARV